LIGVLIKMTEVKVPYQPHPEHPGVVSLKAFIFGMCLTVEHICIPTETWLGFAIESVVYGITGIALLAILSKAERTKLKPSGMSIFQVKNETYVLSSIHFKISYICRFKVDHSFWDAA
jgi:hypothetical protein